MSTSTSSGGCVNQTIDLSLFFAIGIIRGLLGLFTKLGTDEIPPSSLIFLRCIISVICFAVLLTYRYAHKSPGVVKFRYGVHQLFCSPKLMFAYFIAGLSSNLGFILFGYASYNLSVSTLGFIQASVPFWVLLFNEIPMSETRKTYSIKRERYESAFRDVTAQAEFTALNLNLEPSAEGGIVSEELTDEDMEEIQYYVPPRRSVWTKLLAGATKLEIIIIGACGVIVVLIEDSLNDTNSINEPELPIWSCILFAIAGSALWGFQLSYWKKKKGDIPDNVGSSAPSVVGLIVDGILMFTVDYFVPPDKSPKGLLWFKDITWQSVIAILWLGIASGFVLQLCLFYLITRRGASLAALTQDIVPIVGLFVGVLFYQEWSGARFDLIVLDIIGLLLVVLAIWRWFVWESTEEARKKPVIQPPKTDQ